MWSSPAFSRMRMRRLWFNDGKNWEILKAKELIDLPLAHPDRTICVSAIPASTVDLNFRLPSWLGWMKSLDVTMNWSLLATTFSMSLLRVLRRTIGRKAFRWSYDNLFGLGMMIVVDTLKYFGQCPRLMYVSVILMILDRQSSFLIMIFKWCHVNLLGSSVDESLHLLIANLNSNLENGLHFWGGLWSTSSRMLRSTCWWRAVLKEL